MVLSIFQIDLDKKVSDENFAALLLTSLKTDYTFGSSYFFYGCDKENQKDTFAELKDNFRPRGNWVGYFSYDMKNDVEKLPEDKDFFINTPKAWFGRFAKKKVINPKTLNEFEAAMPEIAYVKSNMTKTEYLEKVQKIRGYIEKGDIYQANLTRKFYGEFKTKPDAFNIFKQLNKLSPAPYAAFVKMGDTYIISSSPELFIRADEFKNVVTAPIKGSAPKGEGAELSQSSKDMSENLMITDLMRNDFSRSCVPGSVKVDELFGINEFETISHMTSTITGKLRQDQSSFDLIKNCFPPGSMTGAPKIRAVEICSELEEYKRGIYSGILGYFGHTGFCEFSVVIRTLIIQGNKFEFQVGGGIVYDSDPEKEWEETMLKASAIANVLGVTEDIRKL